MTRIAPGNSISGEVKNDIACLKNRYRLLPYVLEDINLIRQAVGIGEGKLPELPKGLRAKEDQCVLARALSNGWRAVVGFKCVELHHGDGLTIAEEAIDMGKIAESLQQMGFEACNVTYKSYDGKLLESWIQVINTWAMRELIRLFDDGHFPELFENADWPELAKGQVGDPGLFDVYRI